MTLLRNGMVCASATSLSRRLSASSILPRNGGSAKAETPPIISELLPGWVPAFAGTRNLGLAVGADEGADLGIGLGLPAAAVEDAVMADAGLQVMQLFRLRKIAA